MKKDLLTVGLKLEKFSDLPEHIHEAMGVIVEISKQTKNERENIFPNKGVVTADPVPGAPTPGAEEVLPLWWRTRWSASLSKATAHSSA